MQKATELCTLSSAQPVVFSSVFYIARFKMTHFRLVACKENDRLLLHMQYFFTDIHMDTKEEIHCQHRPGSSVSMVRNYVCYNLKRRLVTLRMVIAYVV